MATRSDFAQKLLNDLRTRKERMSAPAAQSSGNSKAMARVSADSYGNLSQNYQGPRKRRPLEAVSTRSADSRTRSSYGARLLTIEEPANQLVPYGGGRNLKELGDLSRTIALALEHRGNFTSSNSPSSNPIMSFFRRFGKRKSSSCNVNQPLTQIINLSSIHINEISKGAQRLNQILRACPGGFTVDGYTVEIGRELLKGAMDLEESLKMLVNIQEGSREMTGPRGKSRIKLLNEDGEEEEDEEVGPSIPEQRLVQRPRFSFDKPSRDPRSTKKATTMALTSTTEALTSSRKPVSGTSDVASHKRSASCGPHFGPEKGRMPNVIAKLMGLEELPERVNLGGTPSRPSSKKESAVFKTSVHSNGGLVEKMSKSTGHAAPAVTETMESPRHTRLIRNSNSGTRTPNGNSVWKDLERVGILNSASDRQLIKDLHQFNRSGNELRVNPRGQGTRKHEMNDQKLDVTEGNPRGQGTRKHEMNGQKLDVTEGKQNRKGTKETEKRNWVDKREQQRTKEKLQDRKDRGIVAKFENHSKTITEQKHGRSMNQIVPSKRRLPDGRPSKASSCSKQNPEPTRDRRCNTRNSMFWNSGHSGTPERTVSRTKNANTGVRLGREIPGEINEVITAENRSHENTAKTLNHHVPVLLEKKEVNFGSSGTTGADQSTNISSKEAEALLEGPKKSEVRTKFSIEDLPSDREAEPDPGLDNSKTIELPSPSVVVDLPSPDGSLQEMATEIYVVPTDYEDRAHIVPGSPDTESEKPASDLLDESNEEGSGNSHCQQLTESEMWLAQTLLKSRLFINTAEALFQLNLPVDFPQVTNNSSQVDDCKILLDCAYEIMRRKGRRQELTVQQSLVNISIVSMKFKSFEDLVRYLNESIEKLKFFARDANDAEIIPEMLKQEVQNRDPDVNNMWDSGWSETAFAIIERDEVIKEVERDLLDWMIGGIVKEFLHSGAHILTE